MANIKSQIKRNKQNETARLRNKTVKSAVRTAVRRAREAILSGDKAVAVAASLDAAKVIDKAVSKGVMHKNQAANRKSGLDSQAAAL